MQSAFRRATDQGEIPAGSYGLPMPSDLPLSGVQNRLRLTRTQLHAARPRPASGFRRFRKRLAIQIPTISLPPNGGLPSSRRSSRDS